ncbi:ABC transporter ATP-binding protein [Actinomadura parmotrematis]|uniref:ABC transporter ATP-binding protein n=1 Tax=Actinomadura parmotrematis TaxID=2864039 RepID=A0ABS7FVS0_9ACTN|nr:ABC transporter ATP-binding protein [Actinomadura parmotrematis]MBW8484517.1 ABC transporter ATP-binding protein [Actinomadura parmotrematis]
MVTAAVEATALTHRFALGRDRLTVLDGVDLAVAPGEFVAVVGPSGSGKSTLLRLLAGLDRPTRGRLTVDGAPLAGPDPSRALVFQDPTLFPWRTVRGNVEIGPRATGRLRERRDDVAAALELVGLTDFADAYPSQLSGGMAQRAALARALVNRPELLLLDEPLGALDALTRLAMQKELLNLWEARGFTAVLVTHDVDEALRLADRVLVLSARPGRVLADLPVDAARPRDTGAPALRDLRHRILRLLGVES